MSNGFDSFLSKPIESSELNEMLREWLPTKKIEEQTAAPPHNGFQDNKTSDVFLDSIKKISGINIEIGMSHVSASEDMYRETLELFCKKILAECEKMDGFLNSKDLHNLAVSVHGMKSSLSTIGAMGLSETAAQLETASKNEELHYCKEQLPGFLINLRSLHEQLSTIFPNKKASLSRPEGNIEYLREITQVALTAADDFDGDLTTENINKLLEYDFGEQINALLENAKSSIVDFDFDAAVDSLNIAVELDK